MSKTDELAAREDIKQLKARYFRCMDTKDWDGWFALFAADAVLDFRLGGGQPARGDEFLFTGTEQIRKVPAKFSMTDPDHLTVHHGFMPEIDILSPTMATGLWAMEDNIRTARRILQGYGYYYDSYEKLGERWLIKSQRLERIRIEVTNVTSSAVTPWRSRE